MRENRTYGSEGGEAQAFPTLSTSQESRAGCVGARSRAMLLG